MIATRSYTVYFSRQSKKLRSQSAQQLPPGFDQQASVCDFHQFRYSERTKDRQIFTVFYIRSTKKREALIVSFTIYHINLLTPRRNLSFAQLYSVLRSTTIFRFISIPLMLSKISSSGMTNLSNLAMPRHTSFASRLYNSASIKQINQPYVLRTV